jgi:phytoene dehydrogenase-like protein
MHPASGGRGEEIMTDRSIIIIGGGIAGLSAGCYGRMNGFRTRIFELHKKPGGLCTSWRRQNYVIDGCLHWLIGTSPASGLHQLWRELGALQDTEVIHNDVYQRIEGDDGRALTFYTDLDRLEKHLKAFAPEDRTTIDAFLKAARACLRFDMPLGKAPELYTFLERLTFFARFFPLLRTFGVWNRISIAQFAQRFRNPVLRRAFLDFFLPEFPLTFMLFAVSWFHRKMAGYPLGGSLAFSRGIEKRYLGLGGEVAYKARVAKIIVENDRAVGVTLEDGSEHRADYVVSAADGHATIFELLGGRYVDAKVRSFYANLPVFPSLVHVALGVNRTFPDMPRCIEGITLPCDPPITIGDTRHDRLWLHIYNFDPALAPGGRTVLKVMLPADYLYWSTLRTDPEKYAAEKERIADAVVDRLDRRFRGLAGEVEMRDVATPVTFHRYTGNWKGCIEGWVPVPRAGGLRMRMRKTLPGLDRFYMAGQWVEPGGGVPVAARSGRNVIQLICRDEKRIFTTTEA